VRVSNVCSYFKGHHSSADVSLVAQRRTYRQRQASRRNLAKARAARSRKRRRSRSSLSNDIRVTANLALVAAVFLLAVLVIWTVVATHGLVILGLLTILGLYIYNRVRLRHREEERQRAEYLARLETARRVEDLMMLSPAEFEQTVAMLLASDGFREVERIGGAGDLTADIRGLDPDGHPFVAQCKRYSHGHRVGSPEVQQFIGMGFQHHRASRLYYFTTSDYSGPARTLAAGHRISLFTGKDVVDLANRVHHLVTASSVSSGVDTEVTSPEKAIADVTGRRPSEQWDQYHWRMCVLCRSTKTRWRDAEGRAVCERCRASIPQVVADSSI
jgi:restriction system protein